MTPKWNLIGTFQAQASYVGMVQAFKPPKRTFHSLLTIKQTRCSEKRRLYSAVDIDKTSKLISKFPVNSEVVFMSYACLCFTVSYCGIGYYAWHLLCLHNKSTIQRLFHQTIEFARNISYTNILYLKNSTDVKILTFFGEKWWIMKWIFKVYTHKNNIQEYLECALSAMIQHKPLE